MNKGGGQKRCVLSFNSPVQGELGADFEAVHGCTPIPKALSHWVAGHPWHLGYPSGLFLLFLFRKSESDIHDFNLLLIFFSAVA